MSSNYRLTTFLRSFLADPTTDTYRVMATTIHAISRNILDLVPAERLAQEKRGLVLVNLPETDPTVAQPRVYLTYATEREVYAIVAPWMGEVGATVLKELRTYDPRFEVLVAVHMVDTWALTRVGRLASAA